MTALKKVVMTYFEKL